MPLVIIDCHYRSSLWMVPPLPAVVPVPVTVSPPSAPVVSRTMPFALPPFDAILWNIRLPEPMVVFWTLSAVAVPELIVLPEAVALTVPPPVALKAVVLLALVLRVSGPVKAMMPPVLFCRLIPSLADRGRHRAFERHGAAGVTDDADRLSIAGLRNGAFVVNIAYAAIDVEADPARIDDRRVDTEREFRPTR